MEIEEEQKPQEPFWKGPIKYIIMLFLLLIVVLWIIPVYSVKLDPEPKNIPTIKDVMPKDVNVENESVNKRITIDIIKPDDILIKEVADRIASSSCDGSRICQAKAIFYFVRNNFDYVADPSAYEYVKSARLSLVSGGGDCDDAAVLLANLEEAIGITTRFVFVPNHVYVQIYLPEVLKRYKVSDDWINLDATCKNCKFGEVPYRNTMYVYYQ